MTKLDLFQINSSTWQVNELILDRYILDSTGRLAEDVCFLKEFGMSCSTVQVVLKVAGTAGSDRRYSLGLALIQKATLGDLQASIEISAHYHL